MSIIHQTNQLQIEKFMQILPLWPLLPTQNKSHRTKHPTAPET